MRILLLRHAAVPGSREGRYWGRTDLSLSHEGIGDARRTGSREDIHKVYTSPLQRARETARLFFPDARQIIVPGLSEMDFGEFEGKTADEMTDDPRYRKWLDNHCMTACPGGEDLPSFQKRAEGAFRGLVDRALLTQEDLLAVVAHGGSIRAVMHRFADPGKSFFDWAVPLAQGFDITVNPGFWEQEGLFSDFQLLLHL